MVLRSGGLIPLLLFPVVVVGQISYVCEVRSVLAIADDGSLEETRSFYVAETFTVDGQTGRVLGVAGVQNSNGAFEIRILAPADGVGLFIILSDVSEPFEGAKLLKISEEGAQFVGTSHNFGLVYSGVCEPL